MPRFAPAMPCSIVIITSLSGCSLDPTAPHPFVVSATAESSASQSKGVLTVPTAVIMREGRPVAANARVATAWPKPVVMPAPTIEAEVPALIEVEPETVTLASEPVPTPIIPAASPEVAAPEYIEISAIPLKPVIATDPVPPVYESSPIHEPVPAYEPALQVPIHLDYGAAL